MEEDEEVALQTASFRSQSVRSPPCPSHSGPQGSLDTGSLSAPWSSAVTAHPSHALPGGQSTRQLYSVLRPWFLSFSHFHPKHNPYHYQSMFCYCKHTMSPCETHLTNTVTGHLDLTDITICVFYSLLTGKLRLVKGRDRPWTASASDGDLLLSAELFHVKLGTKKETYSQIWCLNYSYFLE